MPLWHILRLQNTVLPGTISASRMAGAFRGAEMAHDSQPQHPMFTGRDMLQAGAIGFMGLSLPEVQALRAAPNRGMNEVNPADRRSVIYIFLSGGLAQHDSFDPKPDAPDNIRGEFAPIQTRTPGVHICEHLPRLAARSDKWALVRSLTH